MRVTCDKKYEAYYQNLFIEAVDVLFDGKAKVVKRKSDGINIPDAWLDFDGTLVPVEVKLRSFGKSAMNQLKRYMSAYGCDRGVAVAESIRVDCPDNITFIKFSDFTGDGDGK